MRDEIQRLKQQKEIGIGEFLYLVAYDLEKAGRLFALDWQKRHKEVENDD